jgi:protein-tyrosine-phosphatase
MGQQQRLEMLGEIPPLRAEHVLFVGREPSLPPLCDALFGRICAENDLAVRHGCAVFGAAGPVDPKCLSTAGEQGLGLTAAPTVTAELLRQYEAVLTMTLAEANALAEEYPEADQKIVCLGRTDYAVPRPGLKMQWTGLLRRLDEELLSLAEELTGEGGDA